MYHVDLFRKGSPKKITEPWAKPPETPTDGAGTSPLAAIGDDAEKVKLLKRRLAEARIKSGDASTAERLAFQVSSSAAKKARKEKDAKKNKKKKKKKQSSGLSDKSSSESVSNLFLKAPLRAASQETEIRCLQKKKPGKLYESTLQELAKKLGKRGGAGHGQRPWTAYIDQVLVPRFGSKLVPEKLLELRTLAQILEGVEEGELPDVADTSCQRFKGLEWELEGDPLLSERIQLIATEERGLTTAGEIARARRSEKSWTKFEDARVGKRNRR